MVIDLTTVVTVVTVVTGRIQKNIYSIVYHVWSIRVTKYVRKRGKNALLVYAVPSGDAIVIDTCVRWVIRGLLVGW